MMRSGARRQDRILSAGAFGVLGTRNNLVVKVHYRLGSRKC